MTQATHIEDLDDQSFDPLIADDVLFGDTEDPYRILAELRADGPVIEASLRTLIGMPGKAAQGYEREFMVLSFAGVDQILNDPITFSNRSFEPTLGATFGHTVSVMDPPEHTQYRRILQQAFRPRWCRRGVPTSSRRSSRNSSRVLATPGSAELVEQFARSVSLHRDLPDARAAAERHRDLLQADHRPDHHVP